MTAAVTETEDVITDAKRWLNRAIPRGTKPSPDYWAGVTLIRRLVAELGVARDLVLQAHRAERKREAQKHQQEQARLAADPVHRLMRGIIQ
jgi:hypothetical protein